MKTLISLSVIALMFGSCATDSSGQEDHSTEETVQLDTTTEVVEPEMEIDINLEKIEKVPKQCEHQGFLVDAYTWKDMNGTNYFLRTIGEAYEGEGEKAFMMSQFLYAYHFYEDAEGNFTESREVKDYVMDCEFDLNMSHELDAITLTDLDEDNYGEISFIYRLTCTSDVSPSTQKLMMLESGDKYALRGNTQVMGMGGDYEVGDEFNGAPEGFLEHAEKLWSEHLTEYDFEL
jgi:hypothetical protein